MIKLFISGDILVTGADERVVKDIKSVLTIKNPAYHKIARVTGLAWAVPRDFKYYTVSRAGIRVPRGILNRLIGYFKKHTIAYEIETDFIDKENQDFIPKKPELREYQSPIVEASIASENGGVIVAGTGSGKTIIALEVARRIRKTTLIIVPTTVIQDQFISKAKEFFDYEIGVINAEKKEFKNITVTTWQSLKNKEILSTCREKYSIVMVDECHGIVSDARMGILKTLQPLRLYGLTGSPRRSKEDGRTNAIFFMLGDVIYNYEVTQLSPTVERIWTNINLPVIDYPEMIKEMTENDQRNTLIAGLVIGEVMSGRKVLVLTKRIAHYKTIYEKIPSDWKTFYIDASDQNRAELLSSLSSGDTEFSAIFGTTSLLATGLDIPSLDTLIIACDLKSDVVVQQGAGRILRLFKDKPNPKIIDLVDNLNPILHRQGFERQQFYKRMGWNIT